MKKREIGQSGSEMGQYFIFIYLCVDIYSFFYQNAKSCYTIKS